MNKVFLSGKLKQKPRIAYTPKGEKIVMFPLWVDDGAFSIDVVWVDSQGFTDMKDIDGESIAVYGMLTRNPNKAQEMFRLNASKIIRMEE